jgi:hypothetical protein
MRKDVKRSLVAWPLTASLITILLCYGSVQTTALGRQLFARLSATLLRFAATQPRPAEFDADGEGSVQRSAVAHSSTSKRIRIDDALRNPKGLDQITDWLDVPVEVGRGRIAGIPAPKLNTQSDLFGFELTPSGQSQQQPDDSLALNDGVDRETSSAATNDVDRDVFFADDAPLSAQEPVLVLESATPQLAERPTIDVDLPSAFEAPEPIVADLPHQSELADSVSPRTPQTGSVVAPRSGKPFSSAADSIGQLTEPEADRSTEAGAQTRQENAEVALRDLSRPRSATWPIAPQLKEQLDVLQRITERIAATGEGTPARAVSFGKQVQANHDIAVWLEDVRSLISRLPSLNRLGDPQVGDVLNQLRDLQQRGGEQAERLVSRSQRVAWLQAAYAIERRLAVWTPIYQINSGQFPTGVYVGDDVVGANEAIDRLIAALPETGDADGWNAFLQLDLLRDSFRSGDDRDRQELSQTFLSRIDWPNLHPVHRRWLQGEAVRNVAEAVRPWASGAIDYSALLRQIEKAESNAIDLVTAEVAQSMRALAHADHPKANELAGNLDAHYRNANVRFSISDTMLNHLLPELPPRQVPVRTTLLGSRVTGISDVTSDLRLRVHPSPSSWELTLETLGQVATRSVGRRGPAAVSTSSVNPFVAATPIHIESDDVDVGSATVDVAGRTRLRGIRTSYDRWPLIGDLVRSLAENEYFKTSPLSNRIAHSRMRSQLGEEIDVTLEEKINEATARFSDTVLGPLNRLQLDPRVIDMQSTESRLIARYRMAGPWQLAAMTPRPRALSDNLFSVQMHQSALNNTLEQLVPQNEVMPIGDVLTECFRLLGAEQPELPAEVPDDISIQFAKHRPITVEIEDGRVWITMRIIRLDRGDRLHLHNFIVRAAYRPQVEGLSASLVRDGHLSISGPGMSLRQRLPIRTVFNKVLSPSRPLPLIAGDQLAQRCPEGSGISQFELRDGWIGISVGSVRENQSIASRPAGIR